MELLDVVAIVVLIIGLLLTALSLRRLALRRTGATVDLSLRVRRADRGSPQGRGWAFGIGRYDGDRLLWYRIFSLGIRPGRTLPRRGLAIVSQRRPSKAEARNLLAGFVVLECVHTQQGTHDGGGEPIELAMTEAAVPGFLAWLEAAPDRGPEIT